MRIESAEVNPSDASSLPLCVDLDGTLVRTDTLVEAILLAITARPLILALLPFWILRGKAYLKRRIAEVATPDPALLPYNHDVLEFLAKARHDGRRVVLATAANQRIANAVALHLGGFDDVLGSTDSVNLKGETKARRLVEMFGHRGFDYVGDAAADVVVWKSANAVHVVEPSPSTVRAIDRAGLTIHATWGKKRRTLVSQLPKVLRVHQWLKNLLVFAPLVSSLSVLDYVKAQSALWAFVVFSLSASSVYVANDLLDLASDRRHKRKKTRPFASGDVPLTAGLLLLPVLTVIPFAASVSLLPIPFTLALALYLAITTAYSLFLKRMVIVDTVTLAALYTLRIIAGAFAIGVSPSFWLLAFSMFLFLSLALMKRFTEVRDAAEANVSWISGRGYVGEDLRLLGSLGASAGHCAVLVLALYLNSPEVVRLYRSPSALWLLCPLLLYWLGRFWLQAERGRMHDDPVVFAARDRVTHVVALIGSIVLFVAASFTLHLS